MKYHIQGRKSNLLQSAYVSVPSKESVAKMMGRIKGKGSLILFDRHPEYREMALAKAKELQEIYIELITKKSLFSEKLEART